MSLRKNLLLRVCLLISVPVGLGEFLSAHSRSPKENLVEQQNSCVPTQVTNALRIYDGMKRSELKALIGITKGIAFDPKTPHVELFILNDHSISFVLEFDLEKASNASSHDRVRRLPIEIVFHHGKKRFKVTTRTGRIQSIDRI